MDNNSLRVLNLNLPPDAEANKILPFYPKHVPKSHKHLVIIGILIPIVIVILLKIRKNYLER